MTTTRKQNSLAAILPKEMGILRDYIELREETYVEPTRRGTPRGEAIGFPRKKYQAALGMLSNLPFVELARLLNISHGVILKWRTEELFKLQVNGLVRGFLHELLLPTLRMLGDSDQANQRNSVSFPGGIARTGKGRPIRLPEAAYFGRVLIEYIEELLLSSTLTDGDTSLLSRLIVGLGGTDRILALPIKKEQVPNFFFRLLDLIDKDISDVMMSDESRRQHVLTLTAMLRSALRVLQQ